jgi:hypothetical protein
MTERIISDAFFDWRGLDGTVPLVEKWHARDTMVRQMLEARGDPWAWKPARIELEPLRDSEIVSLYLLSRYALCAATPDLHLFETRAGFLENVGNRAPFEAIEAQCRTVFAAMHDAQGGRAAWLERIGGSPDASHLIRDGWLPFLQSLEAPDVQLWHEMATQATDLFGERLRAAFWVLEQPECDLVTAWNFIVVMAAWDLLEGEIRRDQSAGHTQTRDAFEAVLRRWNAGFYRWHSLRFEDPYPDGHHGYTADDVDRVLSGIEARLGLEPFTRPVDFDRDLASPPDDLSRSVATGLRYSDQEALVLGALQDWHRPEWHPGHSGGA